MLGSEFSNSCLTLDADWSMEEGSEPTMFSWSDLFPNMEIRPSVPSYIGDGKYWYSLGSSIALTSSADMAGSAGSSWCRAWPYGPDRGS